MAAEGHIPLIIQNYSLLIPSDDWNQKGPSSPLLSKLSLLQLRDYTLVQVAGSFRGLGEQLLSTPLEWKIWGSCQGTI